jgi:predicted nucleic acid-binding Zn ribbon protein
VSTWRPSGTPRSERDPKPISDSLDRVTKRLGTPGSEVLSAVFRRWEDLVGPDIAAHSKPVSLRGGVLVLMVDQPAWAAQLRYMTADLLAKLGEVAGSVDVNEIHIKVSGEQPARGRFKPRG